MMVTMIQLIYAIMFLISKAVLDGGMNTFVFVFYRQAFATMFLAPLAFFFERRERYLSMEAWLEPTTRCSHLL
ncbi:hypothetical protein DY000_02005819 [Brassica cretica]|uniref:WAT1-related protein n=1 Tax=Brassica cretica TaxID=69181 RepID=A0ABQ7BXH6_BRACR|nr:hypothetical protein DY000_02005819 [Brassica cretica]